MIQAAGEAVISCCGITLSPAAAEPADEAHAIRAEISEDEYYVSLAHPMTREHHISFLAAVSDRSVRLVKLYPEENAEARFRIDRVRKLYAFCNRHGLFEIALCQSVGVVPRFRSLRTALAGKKTAFPGGFFAPSPPAARHGRIIPVAFFL